MGQHFAIMAMHIGSIKCSTMAGVGRRASAAAELQ